LATFRLVPRTLHLEIEDPLLPLVESTWLPRGLTVGEEDCPAAIRVSRGGVRPSPTSEPTLRLGSAGLWMSGDGETGTLAGTEGCAGRVDLATLRSDLWAPDGSGPAAGADLYPMLTISAALLLGRLGHALVHAAGVVEPQGSAWILVGDARSGKSTTTANLITRGWNYLSDDQVILHAEPRGEVTVTGLLRAFHMDEGWGSTSPVQRRRAVDAATVGSGVRVGTARLGGLLFPRVSSKETTRRSPISPADAMANLVRQSPWLLADRVAAPRVLELLQKVTSHPRYDLRLGLDTFANGEFLEKIVSNEQ